MPKKLTPMQAADSVEPRPQCPKCGAMASYIDDEDYARRGYYRKTWYYCPQCNHRGEPVSYVDSYIVGECINALRTAKRSFEAGNHGS